MAIKTLGIGIGKSVFHPVGLDERGEIVLHRWVWRLQLIRFAANLPGRNGDLRLGQVLNCTSETW